MKWILNVLYIFFVGHEPHQFIRYYPRVTVCLVYSPVLRPRYGSTGSRSDESVRNGGTTSDAEPVPHVSGMMFDDLRRKVGQPTIHLRTGKTQISLSANVTMMVFLWCGSFVF